MRLILMGTGAFAIPAFRALLHSQHVILAIVTRPVPAREGRQHAPANPVRQSFVGTGIPMYAPADVNDASSQSALRELAPDLFVVCDYGQLLADSTLQIARLGGVNLHGSLLPRYRGAAPVNWAIWNGDIETGVTVIHMTAQLDGGPCLAVARTPIGPEEDAPALEERLAQLGVEPVLQAIGRLAQWDGRSVLGTRQDPSQASRARRLRKSDGEVDWSQPATRLVNQVRALRPWPGTFTTWLREARPLRLMLERVSVVPDAAGDAGAVPGTVVAVDGHVIIVATGQGRLAIHQVKPAGKRALEVPEFLRGYSLRAGDRLGPAGGTAG
jgi:methionyl-tRNA formyltransferase